jgi:hypothetical protein
MKAACDRSRSCNKMLRQRGPCVTHTLAEGTLDITSRGFVWLPEFTARNSMVRRRDFKWSGCAREIVRTAMSGNADGRPVRLRDLISSLVRESGHPRDACLRFARPMGISHKRDYRGWSDEDRQRLLALKSDSVAVIAVKLNRSPWAVYAHLRRLRLIGNPTRAWLPEVPAERALRGRGEAG